MAMLAVACVVAACAACASGQALEVKKVDATVRPPADVALYLKINQEDGQPVTLQANDFKIYEDGKLVPKKVKRALLPVKYVVDRRVQVLVDLSGPLVDSEYLSTMEDMLASLVERVGDDAQFGLGAFDGDGIVPFITFGDLAPEAGVAAMRRFRPRSRAVDLWGTFITALDALDAAAARSKAAHQQSTLIVITDRRDKAGRHTRQEALARIARSPAEVYVVGIGDGINREELEPLGKTAALFADQERGLRKPLEELSDRVAGRLGQDFLFAYCSPQKIGKHPAKHTVELRIATPQWHATVEHEFTTAGFTTATCDPEAKPSFGGQAPGAATDSNDDADDEAPKPKARKAVKKKPVAPSEDPIDES